jgi:hypothetical protein
MIQFVGGRAKRASRQQPAAASVSRFGLITIVIAQVLTSVPPLCFGGRRNHFSSFFWVGAGLP